MTTADLIILTLTLTNIIYRPWYILPYLPLTLPLPNNPYLICDLSLYPLSSITSSPQVADSERLKRAHVRDYVAKRAKLDFSFIGDVPLEPTAGSYVFEPVKLSTKTNVPCYFTGTNHPYHLCILSSMHFIHAKDVF